MVQGLAPISYASTIVGFTSFAFTFFTFVRVFWETILTLWSAPKELERLLDNLRLELHEERAYFKSMLRRQRSRSRGPKMHSDLGPLRLLNETVKELMNEFKKLEEPFLNEPAEEKEKDVERSDVSNFYVELLLQFTFEERIRLPRPLILSSDATIHDIDLKARWLNSETQQESLRGDYAPMTLSRRWRWMQSKDDFLHIANSTGKIQERRISCDVSNLLLYVCYHS